MNKHILPLFLIIGVIVVSGCVDMNFAGIRADLGVGEPTYSVSEKLSVSGSSAVDSLDEGDETVLYFEAENLGNLTVEDVNVYLTDYCAFSPVDGNQNKKIASIDPGGYITWEWNVEAGGVNIKRDCDVRYRIDYSSEAKAVYDVVGMSEDQYLNLKKSDELESEAPDIRYYRTDTPVILNLSISETQPVIGGKSLYLDIGARNVGDGIVKDQAFSPHSLELKYPDYLNWGGCQGEMSKKSGRVLDLSTPKRFYDGSITPITCRFTVDGSDVGVIRKDNFELVAEYTYRVDKDISVTVNPTEEDVSPGTGGGIGGGAGGFPDSYGSIKENASLDFTANDLTYVDSPENFFVVNAKAMFDASESTGTLYENETTGDTKRSDIVEYRWDFGDGEYEYGETVNHTYTSDESYEVTLTVEDEYGRINSMTREVHVSDDRFEPTYYDVGDDSGGTVSEGDKVEVYATWEDTTEIDTILVRTNSTGSWEVVRELSDVEMKKLPYSYEIGPFESGKTVCWNMWANDTVRGYMNEDMSEEENCFTVE